MVRFLIIRFSSIGDIILSTPVIRLLKTQIDGAEIHYLVKEKYGSILQHNPHIDRLHLYTGDLNETVDQLQREGFDYIIDLQRNLRSAIIKRRLKRFYFTVNKLNVRKWLLVNFKINRMPDLHLVDRYLQTISIFDCQDDGKGLDYFIYPDDEIDTANLGKVFSSGFIALAIGARHYTKKIPIERLVDLLRMIDHPVIILGGPEDKESGDTITGSLPEHQILNTAGMFTVNQSASLIKQARVIITHDTGMMHVASAFHKKVISVWGSTVPAFGMSPYLADPQSTIFEVKGLRCRPCSKLGHTKCPKHHFRCMMDQDLNGIVSLVNALF